jgi:predicted O-methyltransferase YrrM
MNDNTYITRLEKITSIINETVTQGTLIDLDIEGATGKKTIGVLQRFGALLNDNECYLEVGVYRGKSLLSVAKTIVGKHAYGIDNFSQFDSEGKNREIIKQQKKKYNIDNCTLIDADFEEAFEKLEDYLKKKKIGLYFVDGPHDYRSQLMCLLLAKPFLADDAIIVIDNANYNHVRQANKDFLLTHPEYKLMFEAYSRAHPANLQGEELADAWENWLDGINIIVRDKKNYLKPLYPPTLEDKTLFLNEHRIHPMRNSVYAYRAAKLAAVIKPFKPFLFVAFLVKLFLEVRKRKSEKIEPFLFINSHSKNLPTFNLNTSYTKQLVE